jgi:cytochrome oxidase Cu insertion factor (SCO1/SenC/PrrC family)
MPTRTILALALAGWFGLLAAPDAMALELGKAAPDFSLPDMDGKTVSLKQFRGKKMVLVEFFGAAFAPT